MLTLMFASMLMLQHHTKYQYPYINILIGDQ